MPHRLPPEWYDKLLTFAYFGALGAFAALVGYLVQIAKREGHAVSGVVLAATVVAGFYLGMLFGVAIPTEWENRDAVVLLIGATGMKGFELVSKTARESIPSLVRIMLGRPPY